VSTTWTARLGAVALLLALAGCGSDDGTSEATDPGTSSGSSSSPAPSPTGESSMPEDEPSGGCPYLHADQVTDALGAPTKETAGTASACFFDPESGDGPEVLVSKIDIAIDPAEYASQSRALCQGDVTDVDAGDEAFACLSSMGPIGQLYVGRVLVAISVTDAADNAIGIAAAATLLPEITVP
jgi:hypothetical protein